jgi:hypothetical protein
MTRGDSRRCWAFAALFLDNGKRASVVTVSWVFPVHDRRGGKGLWALQP